MPIESVYATIEIKSILDYSTLEQSVKNVESDRKLNKLPNRNIISNTYNTILGKSDSNIENTLYSFYLFLLEYRPRGILRI